MIYKYHRKNRQYNRKHLLTVCACVRPPVYAMRTDLNLCENRKWSNTISKEIRSTFFFPIEWNSTPWLYISSLVSSLPIDSFLHCISIDCANRDDIFIACNGRKCVSVAFRKENKWSASVIIIIDGIRRLNVWGRLHWITCVSVLPALVLRRRCETHIHTRLNILSLAAFCFSLLLYTHFSSNSTARRCTSYDSHACEWRYTREHTHTATVVTAASCITLAHVQRSSISFPPFRFRCRCMALSIVGPCVGVRLCMDDCK